MNICNYFTEENVSKVWMLFILFKQIFIFIKEILFKLNQMYLNSAKTISKINIDFAFYIKEIICLS